MCSNLEKQHMKEVRYYCGYYSCGDSVALDMSLPLLLLPGISVGDNSALRKQVEPIKTNPPVWLRGKRGNEGKQVAVFHTVTHGR